MRRYQDYDRAIESLFALTPPDKLASLPIERACARLEYSADIAPVREAFATQLAARQLHDNEIAIGQLTIALWSHDANAISRIISAKHGITAWSGVSFPDAWFEALAARIRGDKPARPEKKRLRSRVFKWKSGSELNRLMVTLSVLWQ